MRRLFWMFVVFFALTSPVAAASQQPIERFTLANGMQVVVLPNHRVPAVNHMIWYRIGAADDPIGKSGLAHYHEHLMFKGSPKFPAGSYVSLIDKNGGDHNAFTGRDATSYYVTIAKDRLPLVMQLEADRMRTLTVSETEAQKERQVIIEERRQRVDNLPESMLEEQMNAALFRHHPYHMPVIGWLHEMEGLTRKDVIDFHARYYHPNNAILIVSGDITASELKPLAEKYYGNLPRQTIPERIWHEEPPQIGTRHITLRHGQVKQPLFLRSYASSSMLYGNRTDALPLFVLSYLLGGGKNSVLYQSLVVDQKIAAAVDISYDLYARGPASFSVQITPEKDVPLEQIEKALDAELQRFLKQGAAEQDLARIKPLMQAESIYAREGLTDLSNIMGWMMMAEVPPEEFNLWPERIQAVTAAQITHAAQQLFTSDGYVTGYLLPKEAL